jgi:hypoxanthine-DNA glycosylase
VLRTCIRPGSLDSAVQRDSMVPNDFAAFFTQHPSIERVLFNGAAAETNYRRLVGVTPVPAVRLPSTSPAQTMRFADKLAIWRAELAD